MQCLLELLRLFFDYYVSFAYQHQVADSTRKRHDVSVQRYLGHLDEKDASESRTVMFVELKPDNRTKPDAPPRVPALFAFNPRLIAGRPTSAKAFAFKYNETTIPVGFPATPRKTDDVGDAEPKRPRLEENLLDVSANNSQAMLAKVRLISSTDACSC